MPLSSAGFVEFSLIVVRLTNKTQLLLLLSSAQLSFVPKRGRGSQLTCWSFDRCVLKAHSEKTKKKDLREQSVKYGTERDKERERESEILGRY